MRSVPSVPDEDAAMKEHMRIDSGLVSIMVMVLMTSGLVILTLAREKVGDRVVVLKNTHPETLREYASVQSGDRMDFSFGLLSRANARMLEILYCTMVQTGNLSVEQAEVTASSLRARSEAIGAIATMIEETQNQFIPHLVLDLVVEMDGASYPAVFYDFPLVRLYADSSLSGLVCTSFMVLQNGTNLLYFEGYSDFFLNRLGGFDVKLPGGQEVRSSIASLRIRRHGHTSSYSSSAIAPAGWQPMEDSPGFGRVEFEDVKKNEELSVDFTIETPTRPKGMIAQIIRVYIDAELAVTVANLVK